MARAHALLTAAGFSLAALSAGAAPDRQAAAELFRAGEQAFARGDHVGAALTFEQAYEQAPAAATAFAAATAWFKAGNTARAADAYERALAEGGLTEERASHAEKRLKELSAELARISVSAPRGKRASVAYRRAALIPFAVFVAPGTHRIRLDGAPAGSGERSVTLGAGEAESVSLVTEPAATAPAAPSDPVPAAPADSSAAGPAPVWGYLALGGAALASGGALAFRAQALDSVDEFDTTGDSEARDRAVSQRTASYALWGVAGALAVTGVTILLWPSSGDERSATRVSVGASGIRVSNSF